MDVSDHPERSFARRGLAGRLARQRERWRRSTRKATERAAFKDLFAIETVSPLLERRRHRLDVEVAAGLGVHVDLDRMSQVVSNLLTNAAKYSPEGSRISIRAAEDLDCVRLSVVDEGIGIDSDRIDKLFDAFSKHSQPGQGSADGLGLGLTIVWNLVQLHGGHVHAHSEGPGKGSRFTIELPRVALDRIEEAPEADGVATRALSVGHRVLIVDDNRDAVEALAAALRAIGYTVRVAHDGPAALTAAEDFLPDAALLDIGLPVMDGYELAAGLKARHPSLRLVAVTGYGRSEDRRRSAEAGFERHLVKPVRLEDVRAALAAPPRQPPLTSAAS